MLLPYLNEGVREAGCDEAGRGCIAGPVFAAAVILPPGYANRALNDSKKLGAARREALREEIEEQALCWAVASAGHEEIDRINILNASILAMHRAIGKLSAQPEFLVVDGNRFKNYGKIPHQCVVKGDGRYMSVAAASILAKTHRDAFMRRLHAEFPLYGWEVNKGYPTAAHREAVQAHGLSPHHRRSFRVMPVQMRLDV